MSIWQVLGTRKPALDKIQWEHLFKEPTWKVAQTFGQTSVQCPAAAVPNKVGEERWDTEAELANTFHTSMDSQAYKQVELFTREDNKYF